MRNPTDAPSVWPVGAIAAGVLCLGLSAALVFRWVAFGLARACCGTTGVGGDSVAWGGVRVARPGAGVLDGGCAVVFLGAGNVYLAGGVGFLGGGVVAGGLEGAGTGVGSVGVGTVVGGGSSARAALERKSPSAMAAAKNRSRSGDRDPHPLSERSVGGNLQVLPTPTEERPIVVAI